MSGDNASTTTDSDNASSTTDSDNASTTTNSKNFSTTTNSKNFSTTNSNNASTTTTTNYISKTTIENSVTITSNSINNTVKCNITLQDNSLQCTKPTNQTENVYEPNDTLLRNYTTEPVNYTCTLRFGRNGETTWNVSCYRYIEKTENTTYPPSDTDTSPTTGTVSGEDETSLVKVSTTSSHPAYTGSEQQETRGGDHISSIVGIVFGILAAFCVLAALGFFLYWRKKKRAEHGHHHHHHPSHPALPPGHHPSVTIFTNWKQPDQKPNVLEEIPRKNIVFLQTIGKGMFGTMVKADVLNINKIKGVGSKRWTTVAIKMTLITDRVHEDAKTDFLAELALMKSIPAHPNIIKIYGSCTAHDPYLMILEFASHGDLKKHLQDQRLERNYANAAFSAYGVKPGASTSSSTAPMEGIANQSYTLSGNERYVAMTTSELLTSRTLLSFALQISRGLEHLAVNKIVHRDVAARNILLFEHNAVKISDFGLARRVSQADVYERTRKVSPFIQLILVSTYLVSTYLVITYLVGTYLVGTYLVGTYLVGTYLVSTYLVGTHLVSTYLVSTYLVGTYLVGTYLVGTYLVGTYLVITYLVGTYLVGTYLVGTYLVSTYLVGTYLVGTYLVSTCTYLVSTYLVSTYLVSTYLVSTCTYLVGTYLVSTYLVITYLVGTYLVSTYLGLLPVRWMSPEALFYNQYSQASDVWSYGVFLWELVTLGSTPYPGLDTNHVLDKIKTGELLTCPPHTSDVINELMLSCWISEFSKRPTFQDMCAKLEKLLEAQVEYVDLDQMDDHEYSTLDD
ncbi:hypothetical protein Btru_021516 [Bulinus truncatus]|nr:hypothetical protein Btru_021516 [Bulinus truncatus]